MTIRLISRLALVVCCACMGLPGLDSRATEAVGPSTSESATATDPEIRDLILKGDYADAERLARERLTLEEAAHGVDSLAVARALDLIVEAMVDGGRSHEPEALELGRRAVRLKEQHFDPDHIEVTVSLRNLANVFRYSENHSSAETLYDRSLSTRQEILAKDDPLVAEAMVDLASLYLSTDRYPEAEELYDKALAIQKEKLDPNDYQIGKTLNNMGILGHWSGDYPKARSMFRQALEIEGWIANELCYARTLDALANVLSVTGQYEEADALYRPALRIRESRLGSGSRYVAWTRNNYAFLLMNMGEYVEARKLFERALEIEEKELGRDHVDVAIPVGNLADLLRRIGDYSRARELYERALAIRIEKLDEGRAEVAWSSYQLAELLFQMGEHAEARRLYENARDIWGSNVGTGHKDYAMALEGLADLSAVAGKTNAALALHGQVLEIRENALGVDALAGAESLISMAAVWHRDGNVAEAIPRYERATGIRERSLGAAHPETAGVKILLAQVLLEAGSTDAALDEALRADEVAINHLRVTMRNLGERQALRYAAVRASGRDIALSVAARRPADVNRAWDAVIRSRAVVLDEMAERRRSLDAGTDEEVIRLTAELQGTCRRVANLVFGGPGSSDVAVYRRMLDEAIEDKELAQRKLAEKSHAFRRRLKQDRAGIEEIVKSLPESTALVAYVRYGAYPAVSDPGMAWVPSYLALVQADADATPVLVQLGSADVVDDLVRRWRRQIDRAPLAERRDPVGAEDEYRVDGEKLRRLIWDPVESHLATAKRVLIVPDGMLHLVSLATLPSDSEGYLLLDGPTIHHLSSERDLLDTSSSGSGGGLLAIGGVKYNSTPPFAGPAENAEPTTARSTYRGTRSSCAHFRNVTFESLPASIREVETITHLWANNANGAEADRVVYLTGANASEGEFKAKAPGKRVVHIATHGFFLGGDCGATFDGKRGIGGLSKQPTDPSFAIAGENPLLLSGLALAGANRRIEAGPDDDDGILTAEEVAAMDLTGVEWAVLSACETGVGELRTGEGVLGLRRAFQVAGAATTIMSLWSVEDKSTKDWMRELYTARLESGLDTAESVRAASQRLFQMRRDSGLSTHPFYWGGFVAAGEWR